MLRPRLALAALATVVAVAVGTTAAVLTTHRPATATGEAVVTQLPDTTVPPATTTSSTGPTTHRPAQTAPQPPTTSPRISDPAQAARQVFNAWQAGDQQRALQAATPSAVRTLFAFTPTPELRFTGCRFSRLGYDCFYSSTDVGLWYLDMRVEGGASAGYRVVAVNAQMRFGSPDTAAKARHAASKAVVDALWSRLGDRAYGVRFTGCAFRGIDRGSDCAFGYTTVGLGFSLQVKGGASLGWQVVAIQFAQL